MAAGRLEGVVCVVTGAARGIGLATAERFAAEGGRVACMDVSERRLEPAVQALREGGADARAYALDVADRAGVAEAFARIERDFGAPIGVLVNNAVWARFQPLEQIDEETVQRMFAVGLQGLIWTTQAAAPQMARRGGGSVVNLCSTSALQPAPHSIAYAALKAGVLGLTRARARAARRRGAGRLGAGGRTRARASRCRRHGVRAPAWGCRYRTLV